MFSSLRETSTLQDESGSVAVNESPGWVRLSSGTDCPVASRTKLVEDSKAYWRRIGVKSVSSVVRSGTHSGATARNSNPSTRRALVKKTPPVIHLRIPTSSVASLLPLMRVRSAAIIAARTMTVMIPRMSAGVGDGFGVWGDMRG